MYFNITPPLCIVYIFGNWLNRVVKSKKANIRVGVCAILTSIWHVRNDYIFNKLCFSTFLQVIPLVIHWIHMWSYLRPEEQRQDMDIGCSHFEMIAQDIYNRFGWRFDCRLTCWYIWLLWKNIFLDGWSIWPPYMTHELLTPRHNREIAPFVHSSKVTSTTFWTHLQNYRPKRSLSPDQSSKPP
jgi:hypothetical protein